MADRLVWAAAGHGKWHLLINPASVPTRSRAACGTTLAPNMLADPGTWLRDANLNDEVCRRCANRANRAYR